MMSENTDQKMAFTSLDSNVRLPVRAGSFARRVQIARCRHIID